MDWLLYEKDYATSCSCSKDSVLDDLSRVHSLVKKCIGASTIEKKPTKPKDQGADA
jgi:hypothetical protein